MFFWKLWFLSIILTCATRITMEYMYNGKNIHPNSITNKSDFLILIFAELFSLAFAIGPFIAKFIFICSEAINQPIMYLFIAFATISLIVLFYFSLGLNLFSGVKYHVCFSAILIVSIFLWYYVIAPEPSNIEIQTQTSSVGSEERQLAYFCNLPITISSSPEEINNITVDGSHFDNNELSYWYFDDEGACIFDTVAASKCKIIFLHEGPYYVSVTHYQTQEYTTNHDTKKTEVNITEEWDECNFYLPISLMPYALR